MTKNDPTIPEYYYMKLPLFVGGESRTTRTGKIKTSKKYWLSMNHYRNWHYTVSNKIKLKFENAIGLQIAKAPNFSDKWKYIEIHYIFYPPNGLGRDIGNYVAVIDKFFCDALIKGDRLKDDNMRILKRSSWEMGLIDKHAPRMDAFIKEYIERE